MSNLSKPFVYYIMPQNYSQLSFKNSDRKEVTCVCDTVLHVRLETSQLLADRICLRLQRERGSLMWWAIETEVLSVGCPYIKVISVWRTTDGSHCRIPFEEGDRYISKTLCFFYHNILSKILTVTKCKIYFCAPSILRRILRIRIGFLIESDVRLTERNGQSECIWWV